MAAKIGIRVPHSYLAQEFPPANSLLTETWKGEGGGISTLNIPRAGDFNLTDRILARIADVARRGDFTLGREVEEFEHAWAAATGFAHAVGVSNGTDAIALALIAYGIGKGHRVGVPANTFVGTANAVLQVGAEVVWHDVGKDMQTNCDWLGVDAAVPVAWMGYVNADMLDERARLKPVVLDAAQAVGAEIDGKPLGAHFETATYSLHPLKNVNVWGDGGFVCTNDAGIAKKLRLLRNHGLSDRDTWVVPGFNHRLSTVQAAVGLEVLPNLPGTTQDRRINARRYRDALSTVDGITLPYEDPRVASAYHVFQVLADRRDELNKFLQANDVESRIHYPVALHRQPAGIGAGAHCPNAVEQAKRCITLPIHEYLSTEQIDYVCEKVSEFYGG